MRDKSLKFIKNFSIRVQKMKEICNNVRTIENVNNSHTVHLSSVCVCVCLGVCNKLVIKWTCLIFCRKLKNMSNFMGICRTQALYLSLKMCLDVSNHVGNPMVIKAIYFIRQPT